jgi:hypothetical protein
MAPATTDRARAAGAENRGPDRDGLGGAAEQARENRTALYNHGSGIRVNQKPRREGPDGRGIVPWCKA